MERYLKKSPQKVEEHLNFLGGSSQQLKVSTLDSFFLLLLSPLSLSSFFFSFLSYGPRGPMPLSSLVWSTKEAIGGIKIPHFLLNRHSFFSIFPNVRSTDTYVSGRPDDQFFSFWKNPADMQTFLL